MVKNRRPISSTEKQKASKYFLLTRRGSLPRLEKLDAGEMVKYSEYYGIKKFDDSAPIKANKREKKECSVEHLISGFMSEEMTLTQDNMKDFKRVMAYLSEFQTKPKKVISKSVESKKQKIKGISWKNQLRTELFSKKSKCEDDLFKPDFYLSFEIDGNIERPSKGFGIKDRFLEPRFCTPGPGTYGRDENTVKFGHTTFKKPSTHVPSIEWSQPREKISLLQSTHLPPNRYDVKGNTISDTVNKKLTQRGPYDIFTGPRDYTTIKNHFSSGRPLHMKWWPRMEPGTISCKSKKSDWETCDRVLQLLPNQFHVAPNLYFATVMDPRTFKENIHPFNNSQKFVRPVVHTTLRPAPGRYGMHHFNYQNRLVKKFAKLAVGDDVSEKSKT